MGGLFAATSARDIQEDVFFGTDYHSHLGNYRAGVVLWDSKLGFQREIHNIQKDSFRSRFAKFFEASRGQSGIGCIADDAPSPLIISSRLGTYAICFVGAITNIKELTEELLREKGVLFDANSQGRVNPSELISVLISMKDSFAEGIVYAQSKIKGSCNLAILLEDGSLIVGRDRLGRLPMIIGRDDDGYVVSFESFSFEKLGYHYVSELGPNEVVQIRPEGIEQLVPPQKEMKICSFMWTYYGYPTSTYENVNVEIMRNRNGEILAKNETDPTLFDRLDYVCGVPDSGTPHAMGYSHESAVRFARCYIKYTPTWSRSFLPHLQGSRNEIAKMKQVPIKQLINEKNILFVDDSIVRGTQLRETVEFLKENGAREVHMRSACPPIMYSCKYLNFSVSTSENDLITRRLIQQFEGPEGLDHIEEYADHNSERGKRLRAALAEQLNFDSVEFQSLEGIIEAIGLNANSLCTYCWNGKE